MPQAYNFIKKETLAQVFSCEFCEFSENNFLRGTPLRAASVLQRTVSWPISLIRNNHYESEYEFEIEFKIEFEVTLEVKFEFKIES